jgi:hypothetical protein
MSTNNWRSLHNVATQRSRGTRYPPIWMPALDKSLAVKAAPDRSICRAGSDALRARLRCRGLRLYRAAPPGLRRHRRVGWQLRALYGAGTVRS